MPTPPIRSRSAEVFAPAQSMTAEVVEVVSVVDVWEYPRSSRVDYTYRLAGETEGIAYTVDLQTQHHFDLGDVVDVVDVVVEPETQTVRLKSSPPANIAWWIAGLSLLAAFLTPLLGERFIQQRRPAVPPTSSTSVVQSHPQRRPDDPLFLRRAP